MEREIFDVAIAGGGLAGLALARALAVSGEGRLKIALIDRSALAPDDPGGDARASAVTAASRHLLSAIGVWARLDDGAQPILDIEITDSALDDVYRPAFLSFASVLPSGEAGASMVENAALRRALLGGIADLPGLTLYPISSVESVDLSGPRPAIALGSGEALSARLVVAADGRRSPVRQAAGIKTISWTYEQTAIVVTVAHEKPHGGRAVQHFLPAGPFAILPLTGDRSSLVWTEERARAAELLAASDAEFLSALTYRFGHQLGALEIAGPRASHPLDFSLARSLVGSRVALIGDAARGVHPLAGQGFNIGLKDVAALAECVSDAAKLGLDPGAADVLTRYERWRRFDASVSALGMDAMNRLFSNESHSLRTLRDLGLGIVDRLGPVKRALVGEAAGLTGDVPRLLRADKNLKSGRLQAHKA